MSLPEKFAGFTVVPLSYKASKLHALYLREHNSKPRSNKVETFPSGRTLFVVNIPPDATARELSLFFKPCGIVERVVFDQDVWSPDAYGPIQESEDEDEDENENVEGVGSAPGDQAMEEADSDDDNRRRKKRKLSKKNQKYKTPPKVTPLPVPELTPRTFRHTGSSAHIIFLDVQSLNRALSVGLTDEPRLWPPTTATIAPFGLSHYAALHKSLRPPLPDIKEHVDTYMEVYEYNKAISKQKSEYKKGEAVVDADGFTLVTRGGAYGTTLGGGVGVASKRFMKNLRTDKEKISGKRGKKKPKKHEKDGFYKFQLHEQKRKELEELKANWKKDQEAAARLIESRRYKPY